MKMRLLSSKGLKGQARARINCLPVCSQGLQGASRGEPSTSVRIYNKRERGFGAWRFAIAVHCKF